MYNKVTKPQRKEHMLHKELLKKYKIIRLLHHGLGGEVWLAEHIGLAGRRVIKCLDAEHPWYDTLVREARLLQQCHHPSIPIIYDILEFDTKTYIVEEYIEGENLKQYILRQRSLSDSLLLELSIQLSEILQYIHHPARNILHLDLKPENLLISNHEMKLVDFGSAICQSQQKENQLFFGTPGYVAPEQECAGELSPKTDLYSMGKCMEYMLSFTARIPKGYRRIVERCLRREKPEYRSAVEVASDLQKLKRTRRWEEPRERWIAVGSVLSEWDSGLLAMMLAYTLRKTRKNKVLLLDCTEGSCFERLRQLQDGFVTDWEGITVAGRVAPQEIKGFRDRGYSYIICDFGNRNPMLSGQLFYRCLFTGPLMSWTKKQWQEKLAQIGKEQRTVLMVTGGDASLAKLWFGRACCVRKVSMDRQESKGFRNGKKLLRSLHLAGKP